MNLTHIVLVGGILVGGTHTDARLHAGSSTAAQSATAAVSRTTSTFTVTLPDSATELVVDGKAVPGTGTPRTFETLPLAPGAYRYTFTATWKPNSYTTMTRTKTV